MTQLLSMNRFLTLSLLILISIQGTGQERAIQKALADAPRAYALFDIDGKPVPWTDLVEAAMESEVVLFGEYHDDPVMHWLQAELVRALIEMDVRPAMGAEMLEADDQLVLDEFLAGLVSEDKFKAAANLWPNHFTDYHPLLELAQVHDLPFIATNVPRRYASYVYQHGLDGLENLSPEAQAFLPPLPVPFDLSLPGYDAMLAMGGGHGGETLPMAQAIKDATMAHFISTNLPDDGLFIHFNGAYHSQDQEGIGWYLRHAQPDLDILTIHVHMQSDMSSPDSSEVGRGDFLLITHERMTRTH